MYSGQRPFSYEDQPFPIRVPSGWSPGVMNEAGYLGAVVFDVKQLGQAWFAAMAELRSLPSGHPDAGHYSSGVILGRSIIYVGPSGIDDSNTIIHYVSESDPSGTAWTNSSGIPGHIQYDVFHHYIEDLRELHGAIFSGITNDYYGLSYGDVRDKYLRAYFPNGSGYTYTQPLLASGAHAISLAEVQYNPYPRIGSRLEWSPSGSLAHCISDAFYLHNINASGHKDIIIGSLGRYKTTDHLNRNVSSWPGFLPYPNEIYSKFASLDVAGAVFPACQTVDGQVPSPASNDPSGENTWWGDPAALGKYFGVYTLSNQSGVAHNSLSDIYNNKLIGVNASGFVGIMYYPNNATPYTDHWYCEYDYNPSYFGVEDIESPLDIIWKQIEPMRTGFDPGDFILGYMGWYKQDVANSIRVDGDAINPDDTRMRILEPSDRSSSGWLNKDFIYYTSSSNIVQSGSREIGDFNSRNVHVGVNWTRHPAIYHGFPSYSGEPVKQIAINAPNTVVSMSGLSTRRSWFQAPDTSVIVSGETLLSIITPRFAERNNVKQIAVQTNAYFNSDGILVDGIAAPSGELSIWPQDEDFQNGSGIGYHVMDHGIWMRRGPNSCGMVLISPYNGQRLLFKKAEDRSIVFGHETNVWRTEIRTQKTKDFLIASTEIGWDLSNWNSGDIEFKNFSAERAYHVSWYNNKEEQAVHTDGKYLSYNIAAEANGDEIDKDDYFEGDKYCYYPRGNLTGGIRTLGDGNIGPSNWFSQHSKLDLIPPISFVDNHFKHSPLRSQSTFMATISAKERSGATYNVSADVDVYIAKKPYCVWDIPGLRIQNTGVAEIDMDTGLLQSLMDEGLRPAQIVQTQSWWEKWPWQPPPKFVITNSYKANEGWIVLRLHIFALQESSKGGILEGWGRLYGTASAGITTFDYNPTGGAPGINWQSVKHYIIFSTGWESTPKYKTYAFKDHGSGPAGLYEGSRPFRVWININDPSVIHCVDDVFESGAYGVIYNDQIFRYHAYDKNPTETPIPIYMTRQGTTFIPGDLREHALRCLKSITYIDDEVIALADIYKDNFGADVSDFQSTLYDYGRPYEIATLAYNVSSNLWIFDNNRARMVFNDPGRRYLRLLESPLQGSSDSRTAAYKWEHDGYQFPDGPGWHYDERGAPILFKSNEVCDMWPKIVYAPIA